MKWMYILILMFNINVVAQINPTLPNTIDSLNKTLDIWDTVLTTVPISVDSLNRSSYIYDTTLQFKIETDTFSEIKLDRNMIDSNVIIIHEGPYSPAYNNFPRW
jgi:hypothetical protein